MLTIIPYYTDTMSSLYLGVKEITVAGSNKYYKSVLTFILKAGTSDRNNCSFSLQNLWFISVVPKLHSEFLTHTNTPLLSLLGTTAPFNS